jgi:CelD/BcsL family acetyltransferase involved in cellulose biosynthesis
VELEVINTEEAFNHIKPEWNALLSTLDPIPLPLTHEWLLSWWRAFSADMKLEFRCAFQDGALVGFAPLVRLRERYRGIPVTFLKLAANGHTPYSSVIVDQRLDGPKRREVLEVLTYVADNEIGLFFKIRRDSELKRFLVDESIYGLKRVGEKPSLYTPIIRIDQSWEGFYGSRSRKLKKSLNHKLNRFKRNSGFSINEEVITKTDEPVVQEVIEISSNSWKSSIGNDLKTHYRSRQFLFNLIDHFGASGLLSVWIIRDRDKPVAFELHLNYDNVVYPIRADFDENYKIYSPGSVLEYTALKQLFQKGEVVQYYTCADDYWYLSNWTSEYHTFCNIEVFGDSYKLRCLYWLEYSVIPVVKRFLRKRKKTRPA